MVTSALWAVYVCAVALLGALMATLACLETERRRRGRVIAGAQELRERALLHRLASSDPDAAWELARRDERLRDRLARDLVDELSQLDEPAV